ncbi:MAG: hypothetical protein A2W08_07760 [Candidatus Rokubacteria bacterium RBG_16_73_20]|nr:MAG: hypothetical protein A2050_12960 [Candidatus Rokubacteria bacterium GWA2_73_35]OGK97317.1 MAG: hypothetical protein A2W08_07760 [Candidatus Rokubacteria bacterium RBG_16_73_20]HBH04276.1 hypothetical protein [Candidatus Rokubacteria bacterium]
MLRQLRLALQTGCVTEPPPRAAELERVGERVRTEVARRFGRSLAIRQVDAGRGLGHRSSPSLLAHP